jgi:hypothetical protein
MAELMRLRERDTLLDLWRRQLGPWRSTSRRCSTVCLTGRPSTRQLAQDTGLSFRGARDAVNSCDAAVSCALSRDIID